MASCRRIDRFRRLTADRYANFLLEAALDLEVEDGNDSLSER